MTAHGASGALLGKDGSLAAPILDYEYHGPDALAANYDRLRPTFEETGSPRLPGGLNLGAQLFWQFETIPGLFDQTALIVTYPQYWVHRLTGIAVNEVTSLGCHTDLWDPHKQNFSTMVNKLGWRKKFAPVRRANEVIGPIVKGVAEKTGLSPGTPVYCGIHDSNASLYPYIVSHEPPFSVISTGTWVIVMSIGGADKSLDEKRDTLINVSANGNKVPSARFVGGREFETMMRGRSHSYSETDIQKVLEKCAMLSPSVEQSSGPFSGQKSNWTIDPGELSDGEYMVVVSFYLAMMTSTCLEMTGSRGQLFLEGAMAENVAYKRLLSAASMEAVVRSSGTGTSQGASLLAGASPTMDRDQPSYSSDRLNANMRSYAQKWRNFAGA